MDITNFNVKNYNIFLDINFDKLAYKGIVLMNIIVIKTFSILEINSDKFDIEFVKINDTPSDWFEDLDKLIIRINNNFVESNKYQIKIKFNWKKISEEPDGFYFTYKNNNIVLCTQLEPISARKFIPCFDYPNLKSHFAMVVKLNDSNKMCLSNMSVKKTNLIKNNGGKIFQFKSTPLMSTYLLCLVCGDIIYLPNNQVKSLGGTILNGYSVKSNIKYIDWSVKKTLEALEYFEAWFGIKYPLDKLDIVAIPNFSSAAMENWGLITFREEYILLFNDLKYFEQIKILEVIYHEVAHQWFGNLVTLSEWKDLWLNESTATFFSWMALLEKYSDYNSKEFYWLSECKSLYFIDGQTNTHPVIMKDIEKSNPSDLFDEITYSKGNTIINYVANLLGLDNLKLSIRKYLNEYLYSNPPSGNNLFNYFNEYSTNKKINYVQLMDDLTNIKGYPILYIQKNKKNNHLMINYKTFNLDKKIISDYPINLWLKIKCHEQIYTVELKFNETNDINLNDNLSNYIINPDNEFFCISYYDNFIPNILLMNQVELLKYIHDEFILSLYRFKKLDNYFTCVKNIFNLININSNNILVTLILDDLKFLIDISNYADLNLTQFIEKFIVENFDDKLNYLIKNMILSSDKYSEFVLDKILVFKTIYLENTNFINMIMKLYYYQSNLLNNDPNYSNKYYLSKTIFYVVMKYYQDIEFDNLINILNSTYNTQIINNIIESFAFLNDKNFNIIFNNFKQIIKIQDYGLFFSSISKIISKQEFIIEYWISSRNNISTINEILLKILKNISLNIFDLKLIEKILNYLILISDNSNIIMINKIKDILITNKIVITIKKN